jgi:hypothetical protein
MGHSERTIDAALAKLASEHCGLIRASDLAAAGINRNVVTDRARIGVLTSVQPHVWLFGKGLPTFEQQCRAAVWTSDGTLGGLSALVWHNVLRNPHQELQPTIVLERASRPVIRSAKIVRSSEFVRGDRCTHNGLSVTSIPRTLLDSAADLSTDELERVLDDALLAGKTTVSDVSHRLDQARYLPNVRDLRALVKDRIPNHRITRSPAEQRIKRVVLALDVPAPKFNYRMRTLNGRSVELDLAWPEYRVGLNVDGFRWHGGRIDWKRDLQRDHQIALLGWNVQRIIPEISPIELFALISALLGSPLG